MMPCDLPEEDPRPALPFTLLGGCHCGAVRFRVTVRARRVSECNCSLCAMKGYRHIIVSKEDFELLQGADHVSTYTFNTGTAKHRFCRTCGVHSYYVPRSHPEGFSVNERCLDDSPPGWFDLEPFDGQNWEATVDRIR